MDRGRLKPLEWVGSSRDDLKGFPDVVQDHMGFALYLAQTGSVHRDAKPLKGLGAGVLEVVSRHDKGTYRAVYTVRFAEVVYVLHAFQKKSTKGIATPRREIELVRRRLRDAAVHHHTTYFSGSRA
ncbi:MAG: type II toxin-antitoxin system RelE/ParE family toxin [Alphaproteobacteria bacterium]